MKIKTVMQRKFLAPVEEQFGVPAPIHLSDSEPMKYYLHESGIADAFEEFWDQGNRIPRCPSRSPGASNRSTDECVLGPCVGWESQNLSGFIGIKQLTITSCLLKKYLAPRKRAKQKDTYEIKPTDSQGDEVDAVAAAAFLKFEDDKTAIALLFRSENAWIQLCYQNNELMIESLKTPSDYKKDQIFILCPLEQHRYKLQCAFHQESYVIVKKKGTSHCLSLGNSEEESIFELRPGDELLSTE